MSIKVFVSSTRHDLDPDCRPTLLKAVEAGGAQPIVMESWPAEYLPAFDLVCEKLKGSTHYLGLFAYRRGWIPPGRTASITEEEFNFARQNLGGSYIAVFVPKEGSEIAELLRERAGAQEPGEEEAQRTFLKRVLAEGVVESFGDVLDLSIRATRRVTLWNLPLLAEELERRAPRGAVPRPDEMAELGRADHAHCFGTRVLPRLVGGGALAAAAVLVAGPPAYGQAQLVARLRRAFEGIARRTPRPLSVGCGPLWSSGGAQSLLRALGRELGQGEPASVAAVAARLGELLQANDLVLEVTQLQNFENGVRGFVELFWRPLVDSLPAGAPYSLLCLATHEGAAPAAGAWDGCVQGCDAGALDPRSLLLLPELRAFGAEELAVFVSPRVDKAKTDPLVKALMAQSGGVPAYLYTLLTTPSTWDL